MCKRSKLLSHASLLGLRLRFVLQVREMLHDFYSSRYASCLSLLEKIQSALHLDIHLQRHAKELSTAVSTLSFDIACSMTPTVP